MERLGFVRRVKVKVFYLVYLRLGWMDRCDVVLTLCRPRRIWWRFSGFRSISRIIAFCMFYLSGMTIVIMFRVKLVWLC